MKTKYATIKLLTGEEIFAQVEEFIDGAEKHLVLMDPAIVKQLPAKQGPFALYRIEPWLKLSDEHIFMIDLKHIIYYSRSSDQEKITTYRRWVKSLNKETAEKDSKVGISSSLGFVSKVNDTRESLEKLFKDS
tara:strand:- start:2842 stop:3240 length:399 start_codon:yes stop_codon:yes gene_type:complete